MTISKLIHFPKYQLIGIIYCIGFFFSCSSDSFTRNKAESILAESFKQKFEQNSQLAPIIAKKPEFEHLISTPLFDQYPAVTGIRKISDTEAVVEWKTITKARPAALKDWLESFSLLESRLIKIAYKREVNRMIGTVYLIYIDATDGQEFIVLAGSGQPKFIGNSGQKDDIRNTGEWKKLQSNKEFVEALLNAGELEGKITETNFQLYDDGWRIAK